MSKHKKKHHNDATHHHKHPKEVRKPKTYSLGQMMVAILITFLIVTVAALVYKIVELTKQPSQVTVIERLVEKQQAESEMLQKKTKAAATLNEIKHKKTMKALEKQQRQQSELLRKKTEEAQKALEERRK